MSDLRELLTQATREHWAIGHFNASNLEQMRAIVRVCRDLGSPALIGTSEGERAHLGLLEAVALRQALRHEFGIPVFLNADHSKSVAAARAALDAGYDSIHIDLSARPVPENIEGTRAIVSQARARRSDIQVEGELGYIAGESKVQDEKIAVTPEMYTDPKAARRYVADTGVNRLAIGVGNVHGISLDEPALDISRIEAIRKAVPEEVALVLHAGSGIPDAEIRAAIDAGIANIHINTDIRVAFSQGLRQAVAAHPEETTPYKLFAEAEAAMAAVIEKKLKLFGAVGKL